MSQSGSTSHPEVPASMARYINHEKYGQEILLDERDPPTICSYLAYHMAEWAERALTGRELWRDFQRHFDGWDEDLFSAAGKTPLSIFRDFLLDRGVFIPKDRQRIAPYLAAVVDDDEFHVWTDEEVEKVRYESAIFNGLIETYDGFVNDIQRGYVSPEQRKQKQRQQPVAYATEQSLAMFTNLERQLAIMQTQLDEQVQKSRQREQQTPASPERTRSMQDSPLPLRNATSGPSHRGDGPSSFPAHRQPQQEPFTRSHTDPVEPRGTGWPPPIKNSATSNHPSPQQLGTLTKIISDESKYAGEMYDVFDVKLNSFYDNCGKIGIERHQMASAFSLMLKGKALTFYLTRISGRNIQDLATMVAQMRAHFESPEAIQTYLTEWRDTTFHRVARDNPEKSKLEVLEKLVDKLTLIQRALPNSYHDDEVLRSQLLNACSGVRECELCLFNPASTLEGVCNQLRSSVSTAMKRDNKVSQYQADPDDQYWVDRTYRGQGRNQRFGNNRGNGNYRGNNNGNRDAKKCYVCRKPGCWSTKHSADERRDAYQRFKNNRQVRDSSPTAYQTFLASYEGSHPQEEEGDEDDDEDLSHHLQGNYALDSGEDEPEGDTFYTSTAFFGSATFSGNELASNLADRAVYHQLTKDDPGVASSDPATSFVLDRYSSGTFQGILPDTGAATFSTAGHPQATALQQIQPSATINTATAGQVKIRFGSGDAIHSKGTITVSTPFGPITFHVMPTNTPFLLCLADMDRLFIRFDNLTNTLQQGNVTVPVVRKWGHPWMLLGLPERSLASCHLTDVELRRLHRRFGHPSVHRLHKVLHEAGHEVEVKAIEHLTKYCHHCQLHGKAPSRFKFTLRDDCSFNYEVIVDVMYLEGDQPVLHVVDTATAFNAACFLRDISAKTTWEALRRCWIDVYQGPPDWIVADAGRNFTATEFSREAHAMGVEVKIVPIEAHHSIGKVERYHAVLRRAYEIIRKECPTANRESILQSAVKAVNDTAGPDGLVPTLLVFGAYPRMTADSAPSPDIIQRATAIRKATDDLRKSRATRQVHEALEARNGPDTSAVKDLPLGSEVRVWREKGGWSGPHRLLSINSEDYTVDINGPRNFRSTSVKPYYAEKETGEPTDANSQPDQPTDADHTGERVEDTIVVATRTGKPVQAAASPPLRRTRGRPRKTPVNVLLQETDEPPPATFLSAKEEADLALAQQLRDQGVITTPGKPFEQSGKSEIQGLIDRGVFEIITYDPSIHQGRVFKSRLVNEVKGKNDKPYEKSRLVVQGYGDDGKETLLVQSPTIQRASQRVILALAPSLIADGKVMWLRDITQAYTQSTSQLNRAIYAQLPLQIRDRYPQGTIMKVVKPLYGLAEAGTHWWATYNRHHCEKLDMVTTSYDPCLLLSSAKNPDFAIIGMQTDDTIGLTSVDFSNREDDELAKAKLLAKEKILLAENEPLAFNGGIVSLTSAKNTSITLRQKGQGAKLKLIDEKSPTAQQDYVQQRARGAYIASICQPEACFDLSTAAQHKEPDSEAIQQLNRRIQWQMNALDRGLTFVPLDLPNAKLFVFVDGSFANNRDLTSQLGFIILLANEEVNDEQGEFTLRGNVLHFSSTKSKRVTRSVLASEVYGMVAGVDMAYALSTTIAMVANKLGNPSIPTIACTDSYSLYECLVKLGTTREKRLMIDIMALRQSYERRELFEVRWIHGDDNPADGFTKSSPNRALESLISHNKAKIRMEGWVTRT